MPETLRLINLWRTIGAGLVLLVIYQSLNHHPIDVTVVEGNVLGHLIAYGTLMLWFSQLQMSLRGRIVCAAAFVLMGLGLEFAQGMTDYRTYDPFDAIANSCGVALGWLLAPPRLPNFLRVTERLLAR
jgi:glycopeptide antibiotics resistance protein